MYIPITSIVNFTKLTIHSLRLIRHSIMSSNSTFIATDPNSIRLLQCHISNNHHIFPGSTFFKHYL